jgi:hypothetical protein
MALSARPLDKRLQGKFLLRYFSHTQVSFCSSLFLLLFFFEGCLPLFEHVLLLCFVIECDSSCDGYQEPAYAEYEDL